MNRTPIASLKGPTGATGPRGLPGVNGVANDIATATQIAALDSQTRAALGAVIAGVTTHNVNPKTLARARAALARALAGGNPMKLHFLGHSYLTGLQTAAPYPTNTSPAQVTRMLNASGRFGRVAEGHRILTYGTALGANIADDTRFQIAPEWQFVNTWGYAGSSVYRNIVNTGDISFTPDFECTHLEFVYLDGPGTQPVSFSVDAGSFTSSGVTGGASTPVWKSRITSVPNGQHTLRIRPPASGHAYLLAVRAYSTVTPNVIEVSNGGVSGSRAGGAGAGNWTASGPAGYLNSFETLDFFKPELALILLGVNDRGSGRTTESFLADMAALAQRVQSNGGDVVFLREPMPSNDDYTLGLYDVADQVGAALIETGAEWPKPYAASKAEPFGYIGVDNGHPSPRGHTAIARAIAEVLIASL